jgi:hypothetical protein
VRCFRLAAIVGLFALASTRTEGQQPAVPRPAIPVEPLDAIFIAFRTHQIVALGEAHGVDQIHAFKLALIRDPRFPTLVNDIVVESGNALYQDVMDRYTSGADVPFDTLKQAWQDTLAGWGWDLPMYEELFRAVREVNASQPPARQLRVLLGDPPVDWSTVRSAADVQKWQSQRDTYPAEIIRREVLAKGRRALVVYGFGHLLRTYPPPAPGSPELESIVQLVDRMGQARAFSIFPITNFSGDVTTIEPEVGTWPNPSLAHLPGTRFGATPVKFFYRFLPPNFRQDDPDFWNGRLADQYDALLYLGPPEAFTVARLPAALCRDAAYMQMRLDRAATVGSQGEEFKKLCASITVDTPR